MIKDQSFGAVVVCRSGDEPRYLLVKQKIGRYWSYPKGHAEAGETPQIAAQRELLEEAGVSGVDWQEKSFSTEYQTERAGQMCHKTLTLFLAFADQEIKTSPAQNFAHEIEEAVWTTYEDARKLLDFDPYISVLDQVHALLLPVRE